MCKRYLIVYKDGKKSMHSSTRVVNSIRKKFSGMIIGIYKVFGFNVTIDKISKQEIKKWH